MVAPYIPFHLYSSLAVCTMYICIVAGRGWPLNYHLVFDLVGVGCVLLILLVFVLPKSSEKKRLEEETG